MSDLKRSANMKLLPISLTLIALLLTGCALWTGTDPDKAEKYAEIKSPHPGEIEISIHSKNYRGIWSDGFFEFQKSNYCLIRAKGNGPFYQNPEVIISSYRQAKYKGEVSVSESQKIVTIDLKIIDPTNKELDETSFIYNGKFRIKNKNH